MNVLIGYDGSPCADAALDDLGRAGLGAGTRALVVSVADVWPQLPESFYEPSDPAGLTKMGPAVRRAHELASRAMEEARAFAAAGAERLERSFPTWEAAGEVAVGRPHDVLVRKARDWGAELLVVGARGCSAVERLMLGSVSHQVIRHAPCTVRVARGRVVSRREVRVVIGFDGSPDAELAVAAAASRAWPVGSEAHVVTVVDSRMATLVAGLGARPAGDEEAPVIPPATRAAAERLGAAGLAAEPLLREGDPRHVLLHEAQRWDADCVFVGARSARGFERFLLGSVSAAVAERAHCSVEVARTGG